MEVHKNLFLNCPFDPEYSQLMQAAVFTITGCGFNVRCALETSDASQIRIQKLYDLIGDCEYGIHDLSRVQLDEKSQLPRFNMPLELGVFLGAKFLGSAKQRQKKCLVFDELPYRYQQYLSDIAGQDISWHLNNPETLVVQIRNWLSNFSSERLPSGSVTWERYERFRKELRGSCETHNQKPEELTFRDYLGHVEFFVSKKVDTLETGYEQRWGTTLNDPPLSHIREAIANLHGGSDSFVILIKSGSGFSFLQAHGSETEGYDLEYQDGSAHDHYKCSDELTQEQVIAMFQSYRNGDESWKTEFAWVRHKWW